MNRSPVVAIVCDVVYPYSRGGRELRNRELLPRLAERAEVHVYTMRWWDGPSTYEDGGVTYHAISRLIPLYSKNRRSLRQALGFGFACTKLIGAHFDVIDADHIPYFQVYVLRVIAALKRKPLIVTWHEAWDLSYWRHYLGQISGSIAWFAERVAMRLPDRIIAASPQTAERLNDKLRGHTPIAVVPNGIDLDAVDSSYPSAEGSDLVVVGRLIEHKRVGMLMNVIKLLHDRGIAVTCRVIGDGPERAVLEEKAQVLGIAHAVEFRVDVCEQKELFSLMKSARLFVSLSAREGFGMAVLEAIACRLPVLTTSAPDNLSQHLVAEYSRGVICEPEPDAIAAAIEVMLSQADRGPLEAHDADSWVADYDWDAIADRIADVYYI